MPRFVFLNLASDAEEPGPTGKLPCEVTDWMCFVLFFCRMFISV